MDALKDNDKSKEELINELLEFRRENAKLKVSFEKDLAGRKKAEAELREKELQYQNLADCGPALIWTSGKDKLCNYFNAPWLKFTGRTLEQEMGNGWTEGVHPDDFQTCLQTYVTAFDKREAFEMEYRLKHNSGQYKWLLDKGTPNYNAEGEFVGYIGHCFDISERKLMEIERFELLDIIQKSLNEIYLFDANTLKFEYANRGALNNIGYTLEELKNLTPYDIKQGVTETSFRKLLSPLINRDTEKIVFESIHQRKNGSIYSVEVHIELEEYEGKKTFAAIILDISDRKAIESALRNSESRIRTLVQTIPDLIWLKNTEGVYLTCNTMFERFFGAKEADIVGKSDYDFISSELADFFLDNDRKSMAIEKPSINEEWITFADDGHRAFLETIKTPMYDAEGALIGVLGIGRDITERYNTEQELTRAKDKAEESDRLKTAFLANMSHEIRTPLNGILGFAEILKEPDLTKKEIQEYSSIIQKSSSRMLNIINDIVNISKIEAGLVVINNSYTNLNEHFDTIYRIFKPEADEKEIKIRLKNSLTEKEAVISTDLDKLDSILTNLVRNAIKFTSKGYVEIGCEKRGIYLEFYVKDTGTGINKEKQQLIFNRFRQGNESKSRNYEGLGLGLSITKAFVEMLGGKLWMESEEGKGSQFYNSL